MTVVKIVANLNAVSPSIVLNRRQVEKIVVGEKQESVLEGWRKNLISKEVNAILNGRSVLLIKNGQVVIQSV